MYNLILAVLFKYAYTCSFETRPSPSGPTALKSTFLLCSGSKVKPTNERYYVQCPLVLYMFICMKQVLAPL